MKRALLAFALLAAVAVSSAKAVVTTINFTEVFNDPPISSHQLNGDEWLSYGIVTVNAYWYNDPFDPFDGQGLSTDVDFDPSVALIGLVCEASYIELDWVDPFSLGFGAVAFDNNFDVISTFLSDGQTYSGSVHLDGPNIAGLAFGALDGSAGSVGLSTLTFECPAQPVPEPASMLLLGLGGVGLLVVRSRRRA